MDISKEFKTKIENELNEKIDGISSLVYNRDKVILEIRTENYFFEVKTDIFESFLEVLEKNLIVKKETEIKKTRRGIKVLRSYYTCENGDTKTSFKVI